jgi:peroxiredoxin
VALAHPWHTGRAAMGCGHRGIFPGFRLAAGGRQWLFADSQTTATFHPMNIRVLLFSLLTALLASFAPAQPEPKAESAAAAELKTLVSSINAKLKEDKRTEADLAPELKQFDELLAKYKDQKTDDTARILYMQATLYLQVFKNEEKAIGLLEKLGKDYPETEIGKKVEKMIVSIKESAERQAEQRKIQAALAVGSVFPDFNEKDLDGKPLSISQFKGKVVLVDFWATWCGPCVAELPNVLAAYEQHHAKGFEIVGISLDQDRNKLTEFIERKKMTWPQYFDGEGWDSKLGRKYGITSIPATFLLDREGKIVARNLRGKALEAAVAKALGEPAAKQ